MKGEIAFQVHSVVLHCMCLQFQGSIDEMSHERGGEIERGTLEDTVIPEKEIMIMTDAIVAARTTGNVDLVAGPDHERGGDIVRDLGQPNKGENTGKNWSCFYQSNFYSFHLCHQI